MSDDRDLLQGIAGALLLLLEERNDFIDSPAYRDLRVALFPWESRTAIPRTKRGLEAWLGGKR